MVFIDKEAEDYVKSVIKTFEEHPQHPMYDYVVPPPIHSPYLPRLFIWAPLEHFGFPMKCFIHKNQLMGGGWTDNLTVDKHRNNPRLIFDVGSNILLIQRIYKCNTKTYRHDFKSATLKLLKRYPITLTPNNFPFKKYMRSMVSFDLIDHIFKDVVFGVGFTRIAEGFSALNYAHFQRIHGDMYESFYSNILYSVVSGDKIQNIFLDTYNDVKRFLENKHVLPSVSLSIDYSFKAGMAYQGKGDHKDFYKFLVLLSETGQVVSWKVSTDDNLVGNMYALLTEIKEKLNFSENMIEYIYSENCCEIREIIANLFPNISIKRDLYQMMKSIVSCIPEGGSIHEQIFMKEFGLIFRQATDKGDKRALPTAHPQEIITNLLSFVSNKSSYFERMTNEKRKVLEEKLELLKFHIITGCLSDIPVNNGADSIEKFHHEFDNKKLVSRFYTYSPELAKSIFSVLCVTYNCRLKEKKHICNTKLIPYLPRTFVSPLLHAPLGSDLETYEDLCLLSTANVLSEKVLNKLVCRIYFVYNTLKVMEDASFSVDVRVENFVVFVNSTVNNKITLNNKNQVESTLLKNLEYFDLAKESVKSDGDHLFRSILHQINDLMACVDDSHAFVKHVKLLGLADIENEEEAVTTLRKLFVNEIKTEKRYQNFISAGDEANIIKFERNGVYATNIGDLVIDAFANILGVPFIVISSSTDQDISIHLPIKNQLVLTPLYLAFNISGNGHYDGATCTTKKKIDKTIILAHHCQCRKDCQSARCPCVKNNLSCTKKCYCKDCENNKEVIVSTGCRCGERMTNKTKACCNENRGRASKCPCLKSKSMCTEKCTCKGCANHFGICPDKSLLPKVKTPRPKRDETTYKKPTRKEVFEETIVEDEVSDNSWSYEEIATLISSARLLVLAKLCVTAEAIQIIYSAVIDSYPILQMGMKLRKKSVDDVANKIVHMKLVDSEFIIDVSTNPLQSISDTQNESLPNESDILITSPNDEDGIVIEIDNQCSMTNQKQASHAEVTLDLTEVSDDAAKGIEFALDDSETKFFKTLKRSATENVDDNLYSNKKNSNISDVVLNQNLSVMVDTTNTNNLDNNISMQSNFTDIKIEKLAFFTKNTAVSNCPDKFTEDCEVTTRSEEDFFTKDRNTNEDIVKEILMNVHDNAKNET